MQSNLCGFKQCDAFVDALIRSGAVAAADRAAFLGDCSRHKVCDMAHGRAYGILATDSTSSQQAYSERGLLLRYRRGNLFFN